MLYQKNANIPGQVPLTATASDSLTMRQKSITVKIIERAGNILPELSFNEG
jgi:hypothetical protein